MTPLTDIFVLLLFNVPVSTGKYFRKINCSCIIDSPGRSGLWNASVGCGLMKHSKFYQFYHFDYDHNTCC